MIQITVDDSDVRRIDRRLRSATPRARHAVAVMMARQTEPFVPMLTGSLKNRTQVKDDYIVYPGPYARYLYHGMLMVDPATGSPWATYGAHKVLTARPLQFNHASHPQATAYWFEAAKKKNLRAWKAEIVRVLKSGLNTGGV